MSKLIILSPSDTLVINGRKCKQAVSISPIGEITLSTLDLESGARTEEFTLDAVATLDLFEVLKSFYSGDFEAEMSEQ